MGRIRNIKPEFFIHEQLFELEQQTGLPLRLAFIGLWTQADRDGRFAWRPRALKTQILPYDDVDFSRVLNALATRGFLVKYASFSGIPPDTGGCEYGWIPAFKDHQFINNKEKPSTLPDPKKCNIIEDVTREPRVSHAMTTRGVKDIDIDIDLKKKEKVKRKSDENPKPDLTKSELSKWFDEVMWPSVSKKVGKDLTWIEIQKERPNAETRERIVWYFTEYPKVKAAYEAKGLFYPEMQDPVRAVKNKRYLDELVYPEEGANGDQNPNVPKDYSWTEYCDIKAYRKAKAEGKKNITLNWELRQKYPEEV